METVSDDVTASDPFVKAADEGEAYHALGGLALLKATPAETGGSFSVVERRGDENDIVSPLHVHRAVDELWYVVDGEVELYADGETLSGGPGDTLFAPRGVPHAFRTAADGTRVLLVLSPPVETMFGEVGTRVDEATVPAAGPDDDELDRLDEFLAESDIELLGPPPFEDVP